jgi:TetR/AcrR family tetracycline transcriptional repressor
VSIVPYRDRRRPKPRALDREQVVRAALALLDEIGLDELTMRRLAERLGVKAPSLYRHVKSKEELLVLLADELAGTIPLAPATGPWRARLEAAAANVRRGLAAHRDAARLLAITAPFGPRRLRHIEAVLQVLREAGLRPRTAARAAYHLNNFVTEFAADEARFAATAAAAGSRKRMFAEARRHFRELPRSEFPTLVALADALAEDDPDGLFQFGVDAWIGAIERLSAAERAR